MIQKFSMVVALAAALAIATACGGGDDGGASPSPANTAAGTPALPTVDPQSKFKAVETARAYLAETGIDGKVGELTDPIDCASAGQSAKDDYCVVDAASIYAPGLVILYVSNPGKQAENAWEIRLKPDGAAWSVAGVKEVPPPQ